MPSQTLLVLLLGVAVFVEAAVVPLTSLDNKIHTGSNIDISSAPWMAVILLNNKQNCGGVIVSEDWVLTAAHCTAGEQISQLKLRVGSSRYDSGGDEYFVDQVVDQLVVNHPNYVPANLHNDISAIKTTRPIRFNGPVSKVKLPRRTTPSPPLSTTLTVTGWGRTENGNVSPTLKIAKVVVKEFGKCREAYYTYQPDESFQICAERVDGLTCKGDSGGAVMMGDVVVGLVSFGDIRTNGCPGIGPSVYTKVAFFMDWIHDVTGV